MSASSNIRAGRAYVEVTAETSKLNKSLDAAQSQLKAFGKSCQMRPACTGCITAFQIWAAGLP